MTDKAVKELLKAFYYSDEDICQKCENLQKCNFEFLKQDNPPKPSENYCIEGIETYFEKRAKE